KLDEARAELEAVPKDQRSAEVLYALGRVSLGKGDPKRGREYLLAADRAMPNHPEVLENLIDLDHREQIEAAKTKDAARIALAEQNLAESIQRVLTAVQAKPDDAKLKQLEGVVAWMQGRNPDAEAAFRKAIELDASDRGAYERLARFYAATGKTDKTIEVYEKALEVRPDDAQFHHYLGMLYELGGQPDRAIQRYEDAIRLDPSLAEAKNNLAYIYADQGKNLDRALDLAQDAKTL